MPIMNHFSTGVRNERGMKLCRSIISRLLVVSHTYDLYPYMKYNLYSWIEFFSHICYVFSLNFFYCYASFRTKATYMFSLQCTQCDLVQGLRWHARLDEGKSQKSHRRNTVRFIRRLSSGTSLQDK